MVGPWNALILMLGYTAFQVLSGQQLSRTTDDAIQITNQLFNSPENQDLESITTEERIRSFGYPVELHDVTTQDGYILTMIRIPHGRNSSSEKRKPILFQHGGLGDSFSWFFNYADKSIALRLADLGYDIWLANARGTMYSRRHVNFSDRDPRFFDFSIDEIAKFDIPAEIDYILQTTGEEKLFVLGISLGPPEVHMTLSLLPEYNQKISLIVSLAPTVYVTNTFRMAKTALGFVGPFTKTALDVVSGGSGEFPPIWMTKIMRLSLSLLIESCKIEIIGKLVCEKISYAVYGAKTHPDKLKLIPLGVSHAFSPISTKLADHFLQLVKTEKFQQYDFGDISENLRVYGATEPPLYYLKDTTAPVAVFYAENDFLVIPQDVARTVSELSNVVYLHRIEASHWNHVDFLTGQDVNELFTDHLIELLQKY